MLTPLRNWSIETSLDFAHVMQVVGGGNLQFYTLQYLWTTPFFYQWTHLLPLAFGWPMTVAAVVGWFSVFRRLDWRRGVLLLWVGLYLVTAGFLFVKPVRYLLPIVPPLLILAADLCLGIGQRRWSGRELGRWILRLAALAVVTHAVVYDLAFMQVWSQEDSRIQMDRWIEANVARGASIAIERGTFTMVHVIDSKCYQMREFEISTLFEARQQLLCRTTAELLEARLGAAQYVAITDVNRLIHLSSAPEILPVVTSFYRHLPEGRLGYRLIRRIKIYPEFFGIRFDDDGAEHSFLGFDHPTALLYERESEPLASAAWAAWTQSLREESFNTDASLEAGVSALRAGDVEQALRLFEHSKSSPSSGLLASLLSTLARSRAGQPWGEGLVLHDMVALSLADLGLPRTAVDVLQLHAKGTGEHACGDALRYVVIAEHLSRLSIRETGNGNASARNGDL